MLRVTNKIYNIKLKWNTHLSNWQRWKMKKEKGYHQGFVGFHTQLFREIISVTFLKGNSASYSWNFNNMHILCPHIALPRFIPNRMNIKDKGKDLASINEILSHLFTILQSLETNVISKNKNWLSNFVLNLHNRTLCSNEKWYIDHFI